MEASTAPPSSPLPKQPFKPDSDAIKRKLLKKGVYPTPKIVHTLRKKQIRKHNRKLNELSQTQQPPPLTPSQKQTLDDESRFQALKREYRDFTGSVSPRSGALLVGRPWERIESVRLREVVNGSNEFRGEGLKREDLRALKEMIEEDLKWVLDDDDVEDVDGLRSGEQERWQPRRRSEGEAIRFLVDRLSRRDVTVRDWKLAKIMKQSGLRFSERQLLRIVEGLGKMGKWEQAVVVVEWVYNDKERRDCKSRFVYTKLLSVLGKERRPHEALHVFNVMREDCNIYPDMAAYHSIAVTLGQAGLLKELIKIIEWMRLKPSKKIRNMRHKNWDPVIEPDLVIYNAVLNACVPSQQWKGVSWVFEQLRKNGLKPNGATYGLAMEVMLHSGKYALVHEFFRKMNKSGESPKALTYKVLVRTFWEEGRVDEAVEAVRDMENRGVVGTASVYYELACCLCNKGRWEDALLEVENIKKLRHCKPLEYTFTGMIQSSIDGGHMDDCISIFEFMKSHCIPNIGTINTMLKVYSRNDMFSEAKQQFEEITGANGGGINVTPDEYTYSAMLEASARSLQWEYFEHVYKEMTFSGYQLDQSKHASWLVEASRAGKFHLLEHALDAILEAGEIPHPLLFIEMVVQATVQHDYEKAVALVNAMAYAPFQVSEKQWSDIFEKNGAKISRDGLEKLLKALETCHVSSEVTVSNLSRSLRHLCGSDTSRSLSSSYASDVDEAVNSCLATDRETTSNEGEHAPSSGSRVDENLGICGNMNLAIVPDRTTDMYTNMESHTDDMASGVDTASSDDLVLHLLDEPSTDDVDVESMSEDEDDDDSHTVKLPSAYEILESWKKSRKDDGIFFPFQLGQKKAAKVVDIN